MRTLTGVIEKVKGKTVNLSFEYPALEPFDESNPESCLEAIQDCMETVTAPVVAKLLNQVFKVNARNKAAADATEKGGTGVRKITAITSKLSNKKQQKVAAAMMAEFQAKLAAQMAELADAADEEGDDDEDEEAEA